MRRSVYLLPIAALAISVVSVGLSRAGPPRPQADAFSEPLFGAPFLVASAVVGAVILSRHRWHAVGLVFAAMALIESLNGVMGQYAALALRTGASLPGWTLAAWFASWIWFATIALIAVVLPLIFPTGTLLSASWRGVLVLAAASFAALALGSALAPGPLEAVPELENPFALAHPAVEIVGAAGFIALAVAIVLGVASMVVRFRRAAGVERQQMKWLLYAIGGFATSFVIASYFYQQAGTGPLAIEILLILAWTCVPIAAGIAILRYRLYDIDVLINRTLVYAALTATLGAAYVGSVLLLQTALRPFTGGSDIAVAVSTLAVVALFQPLRRRIQDWVDRRFYRSRYDAQRTLDAFTSRLRDEIDLAELERELVGVVAETVRPRHASLWLRRGGA
ncbi:MAG: hypothetical protein ACRDGT_05195 [Candidatus Limnocylindria bacterium]